MYKYRPQAGDTTEDVLLGRIDELKDKITRRNKQIKDLKLKIQDLLEELQHDE
jgi:hypothetical protein